VSVQAQRVGYGWKRELRGLHCITSETIHFLITDQTERDGAIVKDEIAHMGLLTALVFRISESGLAVVTTTTPFISPDAGDYMTIVRSERLRAF
jgi:hypothetical protein